VGEERSSSEELVKRIEEAPETFSPNALFRPVVQDYCCQRLSTPAERLKSRTSRRPPSSTRNYWGE